MSAPARAAEQWSYVACPLVPKYGMQRTIGDEAMPAKVLIVDDHPAVREGLAVRIAAQATWRFAGRPPTRRRPCNSFRRPTPTWSSWTCSSRPATGWTSSSGSRPGTRRAGFWSGRFIPMPFMPNSPRRPAPGLHQQGERHGADRGCIRQVRDGKIYLCEETTEQVLQPGGRRRDQCLKASRSGVALRTGSWRCSDSSARALSASQIAECLHRSRHTVEAHRQAIKSQAEL